MEHQRRESSPIIAKYSGCISRDEALASEYDVILCFALEEVESGVNKFCDIAMPRKQLKKLAVAIDKYLKSFSESSDLT